MAVRSKRLAIGATVTGQKIAYTVPPLETAIVRTLVIYNNNAAPNAHNWAIRPAGSAVDYYFNSGNIPAFTVLRIETWIILQPGDELRVTLINATGTYSVHGSELEGVAD